jgi:hypothetical protein
MDSVLMLAIWVAINAGYIKAAVEAMLTAAFHSSAADGQQECKDRPIWPKLL